MKTSCSQYAKIVEYMEKNGDLSKTATSVQGRYYVHQHWRKLTAVLNKDGAGDSKSEEKWRKVWSDWKNNTKKKFAKITQNTSSHPSERRVSQLSLTDLEQRVMMIVRDQAAVGKPDEEAGFQADHQSSSAESFFAVSFDAPPDHTYTNNTVYTVADNPGPSEEPAPTQSESEEDWQPPSKKTKEDLTQLVLDSNKRTQKLESEKLRQRDEELRLRGEELRLREEEMRERVRQRDLELVLQSKWLEFMKETMNVLVCVLERKLE